ncbi:hypothetical protein [Inconstantimicrobium porci]|nr:hypothetical protein [Inconstantimicrobium porci]
MEVKEFGNEEIAYLIGYNECSSCGFKSTCIKTHENHYFGIHGSI